MIRPIGHRNALQRWWRRLWCWHLSWHPTLQDNMWRLGLKHYRCDWCGKGKHFPKEEPPINYMIDVERM